MSKDTGGAAFPHDEQLDSSTSMIHVPSQGMTLRDYFAAKAMPTMVSMCQHSDGGWDHDTVAQMAYSLADAMLAERAA